MTSEGGLVNVWTRLGRARARSVRRTKTMHAAVELFLLAAKTFDEQDMALLEYHVGLYDPTPEDEAQFAAEAATARALREAAAKEAEALRKAPSTVEFWDAFSRASPKQVGDFVRRVETGAGAGAGTSQ